MPWALKKVLLTLYGLKQSKVALALCLLMIIVGVEAISQVCVLADRTLHGRRRKPQVLADVSWSCMVMTGNSNRGSAQDQHSVARIRRRFYRRKCWK